MEPVALVGGAGGNAFGGIGVSVLNFDVTAATRPMALATPSVEMAALEPVAPGPVAPATCRPSSPPWKK